MLTAENRLRTDNIDLENNKEDLEATPPRHRRPRAQSKVMPELKATPGITLGFFQQAKPEQVAIVTGGLGSVFSLAYYLVPAVASGLLTAVLPTLVIGGVAAGMGAGAKVAYDHCKKNSPSRGPSV